jgi:hypothetical protein
MTSDEHAVEFTWERIVAFARDPSLLCQHDPVRFRQPAVYRRYMAAPAGALDLDFATEWMLLPNTYPYNVAPGIAHYVLFRRRDLPLTSPSTLLAERFGGCEVAWYENPEPLRSIKSVRHYQVFVREARDAA